MRREPAAPVFSEPANDLRAFLANMAQATRDRSAIGIASRDDAWDDGDATDRDRAASIDAEQDRNARNGRDR